MINFDVLIVYTEALASSAFDPLSGNNPFAVGSRNESYNTVYGYFMDYCSRSNLSVAFTTSADIVGPGQCRSFWSRKNKKWIKINMSCFSNLIFDKFSPTRNRIRSSRKLLFSSDEVISFNDPGLFNLFFDKQRTYDRLDGFAIPTISIERGNWEGVMEANDLMAEKMLTYPSAGDFGDDLVMKDRFGAGGRHIYKIQVGHTEKMKKIIKRFPKVSFVIQPFALFDKGFTYNNNLVSTDIRVIYLNGKIAQSYIRVAKKGDFRCNEHQGGSLIYLPLNRIPKEVVEKSKTISDRLNKKNSLFALDFIVSNNGNIYLLEGNTGPGLDWNLTLKRNETEAKKLIRLVVKELVNRTKGHLQIPKVLARDSEKVDAVTYSALV